MSIMDIYHSLFDYKIHASFAAFLRVITCGYITAFIAWIIKDALLFSHPNKIFSGENYIKFCKEKYPQISLFNYFYNSCFAQKFIFVCFFIFGITSTLGFLTNFSILLFSIFFISIQSRISPIIFTGGDVVSRVLLLSLLLTDCGSQYSLDRLLNISSNSDFVNGIGIRMAQITIALGYFCSGVHKLNDIFWISGEAFKNSMHSKLWSRRIFLNIFKNKYIFKTVNYYVLFFELFSPILFFIKEFRPLAIMSGVLFHLGIIIFMRIGFFGPIMLISVMYFINEYFK